LLVSKLRCENLCGSAWVITIGKIKSMLPTLTVNRSFMKALIAAEAPCCGLGLVEVDQKKSGFLALRPGEVIPEASQSLGFNFGHSLYGSSQFEVVHFSFEFYGFGLYHVLVNPNNPLVQVVLKTMLESRDYFFFSIEERSGSVTAFRNEIDSEVMANFQRDWPLIESSNTTKRQYHKAVSGFIRDDAYPTGSLMHWLELDNLSYLDLRIDRLDLNPSPG
jgi:hypothetical protein